MNSEVDDAIFVGISGARLPGGAYELGEGVVLRPIFAHLMAPFLMAFAPAPPGRPHPPPWRAAGGGLAFDIHIELVVPKGVDPIQSMDRLNTAWWILALLRLRTAWPLMAPVVSSGALVADVESEPKHALTPLEIHTRRSNSVAAPFHLSEEDLGWVRNNWRTAGGLLASEKAMAVFRAFDFAPTVPSSSLALLTVWGALEHLLAPAKQELRFRMAASIAAYLEPAGPKRHALHKMVLRLYDRRSRAAHSADWSESSDYDASLALLRRVLLKMIDNGHEPKHDEVEQLLFLGR